MFLCWFICFQLLLQNSWRFQGRLFLVLKYFLGFFSSLLQSSFSYLNLIPTSPELRYTSLDHWFFTRPSRSKNFKLSLGKNSVLDVFYENSCVKKRQGMCIINNIIVNGLLHPYMDIYYASPYHFSVFLLVWFTIYFSIRSQKKKVYKAPYNTKDRR